ncbi:hypothetical protein LguiA_030013 [Lonicera macranthoides]
MVQCLENRSKCFLPIFYNIRPDDVQHQHDSYKEACRQHKKCRYDKKLSKNGRTLSKKLDN